HACAQDAGSALSDAGDGNSDNAPFIARKQVPADKPALRRAGAGSVEDVVKVHAHVLLLAADLHVGIRVGARRRALISLTEAVPVYVVGHKTAALCDLKRSVHSGCDLVF